jgi:stage V sporulation protein SpoVS
MALIIKTMLESQALSVKEVVQAVGKSPTRTQALSEAQIQKGFLERTGNHLRIVPGGV